MRSAGPSGAAFPLPPASRPAAVTHRPLLAGRYLRAAGGVKRGPRRCLPGGCCSFCCAVSGASPPPCRPAPPRSRQAAAAAGGSGAARQRCEQRLRYSPSSPALPPPFLRAPSCGAVGGDDPGRGRPARPPSVRAGPVRSERRRRCPPPAPRALEQGGGPHPHPSARPPRRGEARQPTPLQLTEGRRQPCGPRVPPRPPR